MSSVAWGKAKEALDSRVWEPTEERGTKPEPALKLSGNCAPHHPQRGVAQGGGRAALPPLSRPSLHFPESFLTTPLGGGVLWPPA